MNYILIKMLFIRIRKTANYNDALNMKNIDFYFPSMFAFQAAQERLCEAIQYEKAANY